MISKITGAFKKDAKKSEVKPSTEKIITKNTNFLKWTDKKDKKEALYSNFFQKGKDGKITVWQRKSKTLLEFLTQIFAFITPIVALLTIWALVHVLIKWQETNDFAENFPIFCGYLNSWLKSNWDTDFDCKTVDMVQKEYKEKNKKQDAAIVDVLSFYIPVKVSENLLDTSPEKKFVVNTFKNKSDINAIIQKFKEMTEYSQNSGKKHIVCTGINIKDGDTLSTQCNVYGMNMWDDSPLNSARIEALKFTEFLADTNRSQFILTHPPTTLTTEEYIPGSSDDEFFWYATRTSLPIAVKYIPFTPKN